MTLNRIDLAGTIVQPPTVKFTPRGFAYGDMTVRVGLPHQPDTTIDVAVHLTGEVAQLAGQHLHPGDQVVLWGALSQATSRRGGIHTVSLRGTGEGFVRTTLAPTGVAFNRVNLYGELASDPEPGPAGTDRPRCELLLTVPIPGERREAASVPVLVTGRLAGACATLRTGQEVLVWGYLSQQTWQRDQAELARLRVVAVGIQPAGVNRPDRAVTRPRLATANGGLPQTAVGRALQEAVGRRHGGR